MADLMNFEVKQVGNAIRIYGDVVESGNQSQVIASFGPAGLSYDAWWADKSADEKCKLITEHFTQYMVDELLSTATLSGTRG